MNVGPPLRILSLCSGIGGLDEGARRAVGGRVVAYCERDPYAAAVLLARMESEDLEPAPVWVGDMREMDAGALAGHVDLVTAGYPCQPFSDAGKRLGEDDPRHLWPAVRGIIGVVRPRYVFLENVAGHLRLGFDRVLGDLAELGFDAEWATLRAADVGAPHLRRRLFILAYAANSDREPVWTEQGGAEPRGAGALLAGADGTEGPSSWRAKGMPEPAVRRVADGCRLRAHGVDLDDDEERRGKEGGPEGGQASSPVRGVRGHGVPPGEAPSGLRPADEGRDPVPEVPRQGRPEGRVSANARVADMRCLPGYVHSRALKGANVLEGLLVRAWKTECGEALGGALSNKGLRVVQDRVRAAALKGGDLLPIMREQARLVAAQRADRLRCLGNAVVPDQAEAALRALMERAHA